MKREIINTTAAPAPIGPYNQAIRIGKMIYCSGQIPLDPKSGGIVGEGDVETQTRQVIKNIEAVLKSGANVSLKEVVKTTIFLKSMDDFPKVNAIYGEYFHKDPPARSCVEVARLPKDVLVEIEVIAYDDD